MNLKCLFLICLSSLSFNLVAQENPKQYLQEAITIMKDNSVNRSKIDWTAFTKRAMDSLGNKQTIKQSQSVIRYMLRQLGDSHSNFVPAKEVEAYLKTYEEQGMAFPYAQDSLINAIAYLTVPAIGNLNEQDWDKYVRDFYQKVKALEAKHPKAWAIDVRENQGGMFAPMFKVVEPFLDTKNAIGSKDNAGMVNYYNINKADITFGKLKIAKIAVPVIKLKNPRLPVYILASKKTASSGEFVVASFVGQKNANIVGVNTQGLTSDNSDFRLSDGSIMILTTGTLVNRKGYAYSELGKGIEPTIKATGNTLSAYIDAITATIK